MAVHPVALAVREPRGRVEAELEVRRRLGMDEGDPGQP
jgi:hypothetical protein